MLPPMLENPLDHPRFDPIKLALQEMNRVERECGIFSKNGPTPDYQAQFARARMNLDRAVRRFDKSLQAEFRRNNPAPPSLWRRVRDCFVLG